METRPTQFSYVCNATRIEPGNSICISPFFDNSESPLQNSRVVRTVILITPAWQTEVFSTFSTPNVFRRSEEPERGRPPLGNKQIFSTSGLEVYRKTFVKLSISERAAHLIVNSMRQSSSVNYNLSWKKWSIWSFRKLIHPFRCPIKYILDLACLYEKGYGYRSVNCYRDDDEHTIP